MSEVFELPGDTPDEQLFRSQWTWSKGIALPFAFAGASGGWMAATFLSLKAIDWVPRGLGMETAVVGGLVAFCCGAFLSLRKVAPADAARFPWLRVVASVLLTGAIAGGLVDLLTYQPTPWGERPVFVAGMFNGLVGVLPVVPVSLVVVRLATRAARARRGSLVAQADRQAIWTGFAGGLSGASLCVWPAWFDARHVVHEGMPWPALVVVGGCGAVAGWTMYRGRVDVRQLERLRRSFDDQEMESTPDAMTQCASRTDLGVGQGRRASYRLSGTAYRARRQTTAVLLGDPSVAFQILVRARRMNDVVVLTTLLVAFAHALGASRAGLI